MRKVWKCFLCEGHEVMFSISHGTRRLCCVYGCFSPPPCHLHTVTVWIFQEVYFHPEVPESICSNNLILGLRNHNAERWFGQGTPLLRELEPRSACVQAKQYTSWRQRHGEATRRGEGRWRAAGNQETCVTTQVLACLSHILSLAIHSHHSLILTPFPHPPPSQLWSQAIPRYLLAHRSSPLPFSMLCSFSSPYISSSPSSRSLIPWDPTQVLRV